MPELRNPRWERFAKLYVELGNASEAYRKAGYRDHGNASSLTTRASRMLTFVAIKQRITVLRAQEVFNCEINRRELEGFLAAVIRTPSGEVTPNHPLSQSHEISAKGIKVRMPDKVQAAVTLARLNGLEVAQRVDIAISNPLTDYLRALRGTTNALNDVNVDNAHNANDEAHAP